MTTSEADLDAVIDELVTAFPPSSTNPSEFLGEQFDRGLAWTHFPRGNGGLGLTPADQLYTLRRLSKLGAPSAIGLNVIGRGMVAPSRGAHGTEEPKAPLLPPLFKGEENWGQLFSEPGAGSDI